MNNLEKELKENAIDAAKNNRVLKFLEEKKYSKLNRDEMKYYLDSYSNLIRNKKYKPLEARYESIINTIKYIWKK